MNIQNTLLLTATVITLTACGVKAEEETTPRISHESIEKATALHSGLKLGLLLENQPQDGYLITTMIGDSNDAYRGLITAKNGTQYNAICNIEQLPGIKLVLPCDLFEIIETNETPEKESL